MKKMLIIGLVLGAVAFALAQNNFTAEQIARGLFAEQAQPGCLELHPEKPFNSETFFCFDAPASQLEIITSVKENYAVLGLRPHPEMLGLPWRALDAENGLGLFVLLDGQNVMVNYLEGYVIISFPSDEDLTNN